MENQDSVCFVGVVKDVQNIPGADKIELVVVNGWNCTTSKGEYKVGDLVAIATTNAVIPFELSEKMGVTNYLRKGRVRTVKIRGVYSECLIISSKIVKSKSLKEGQDMMNKLGVTKYEPPVKQVQLASGRKIRYQDNPNFHVYYKFPNLKNVDGMFTKDDEVEISRKIHGTNARFGIVKKNKSSLWNKIVKFMGLATEWIDYEFVVGSHNVEKGSDTQGFYETNWWYDINDFYRIKDQLWDFVKKNDPDFIGNGIVIYGEIYGPGIQKNYDYGLKEIEVAFFDAKINDEYLPTIISEELFSDFMNLPYVDILYRGNWNQEIQDKFTFDNFIPGTKVPHEGIVIKHVSGERGRIAKVINPDYLIYAEKKDVGDSH